MVDQTRYRNPKQARTAPCFIDDQKEAGQSKDKKMSLIATLDIPLLLIVGLLLVLGSGMVFSTTFNWSLEEYGSPTAIFFQFHMRNVVLALIACVIFAVIDYRFWRRFAPILLLITLGALVAVNFFGDDVFGARRALIGGSLQPGELAEFTSVLYMAAWLGAKRTRPNSFIFGLVPFSILLALVLVPIALQPDFSTIAVIGLTTGAMYFLAGARISHLVIVAIAAVISGVFIVQNYAYAQDRFDTYIASLSDPTESNPHMQQAITAFVTGGWTGKGLGESTQKFNNALPAPHTDSIFAVIGEELGVLGASFVVFLYATFVMRGFHIAQRAVDPFGALLAIGLTLSIIVQALLNIAVMTAIIPTSGLPLPFISYGGSALIVSMIGIGLLLNISRIATIRENASNRRQHGATYDRGWGDRRTRLSRASRRRTAAQVNRQA